MTKKLFMALMITAHGALSVEAWEIKRVHADGFVDSLE